MNTMTNTGDMDNWYAVYRVCTSGVLVYAPRSCTTNKKLAEEIAAELTAGEVTMPDGTMKKIKPYPHVARLMFGNGIRLENVTDGT